MLWGEGDPEDQYLDTLYAMGFRYRTPAHPKDGRGPQESSIFMQKKTNF